MFSDETESSVLNGFDHAQFKKMDFAPPRRFVMEWREVEKERQIDR
jgi:hypothetical protein